MPAPYTKWNYKGSHAVAQSATNLFENRKKPCALSPFIFMTDPQRVVNPVTAAMNLPKGAAIIYRHFGRSGHEKTAEQLRGVTFEREQQFLIGHDPELAIKVGADGVHFRRDASLLAPTLWRKNCPEWIITMAGLKGEQDYHADLSVLDALFISTVFYSKSPSAGNPIGIQELTSIAQKLDVPIIALGGINDRTAHKLLGSGATGLAGIEGLLA